jgi:hypothetical protein
MPQCKPGCESGRTTNRSERDTLRAAYWAPCDYAIRPHFMPAEQLACCCELLLLPCLMSRRTNVRHSHAPAIQHFCTTFQLSTVASSVPASHRLRMFYSWARRLLLCASTARLAFPSCIPCSKPFFHLTTSFDPSLPSLSLIAARPRSSRPCRLFVIFVSGPRNNAL